MKSYKLIFIICLLAIVSCKHPVAKNESLNTICYIDSGNVKTSLKKIILMYLHQHPSYKSYYLNYRFRKYYLVNGLKQKKLLADDGASYLILSPTYNYRGEYKDINNQMPSCYFKLNGCFIFLASNMDYLKKMEVMDAHFKNKYASNMSLKEYFSNSWLIKVSNYEDDATIIKKNLWGIYNVKQGASGKFKAPVIKQ